MSFWDDITGFIGDNKGWLQPLATAGLGALKQSNSDNTQSEYLQYLKDRENQNYQNSINQINAYNTAMGANVASSNAARASARTAASANQAAQLAAAKKAKNQMQKTYKNLLAMYAPYRQTADRLLPQMTQTYEGSLGIQNSLAKLLASPEQQAKFSASVPAWQINVPLPDSLKAK